MEEDTLIMKGYIKLALNVGLLIIYIAFFGLKSLKKFSDGGVLINQKTLTQDSIKPEPGKQCGEIESTFINIFSGLLILPIDPTTGLGIKVAVPYENFNYSNISTNLSLGKTAI